jgi:hypothetical protein
MKKIFIVLIISLVIISCGKKETPDTSTKDKTTTQDTKKETGQNSGTQNTETGSTLGETKPGKIEMKWDFRPLKRGQYDEPMTDVYLIVNGKSYFVSKIYYSFSETLPSGYKDYEIPSDALASCRGWWAGAGIDYWVTRKDNELIVTGRDIGETSDENGEPGDFTGKPVKVTTIKLD